MSQQMTDAADELINAIREWPFTLFGVRRSSRNLCRAIDHFSHRVVNGGWDGMIAHPDCTFLTKSGAGHMHIPWRKEAMMAAVYNVRALWAFPVRLKAIENPSGRLSTLWRPPDQTIQPHMFGHPEFKATCWWLDGLPPLVPTNQLDVPARGTREYVLWNRVHREGPGKKRATNRSRTLLGIGEAIAAQWGSVTNASPGYSLGFDMPMPGHRLALHQDTSSGESHG